MVQSFETSEPEKPYDMVTVQRSAQDLSSAATKTKSVLERMVSIALGYSWEEPDAVTPHVRICEGESR